MHYNNVLTNFKVEWTAYKALRKEDDPSVPKINDRDSDRKIIWWAPIFLDCMDATFGGKGPLCYVLRDEVTIPPEAVGPLAQFVPANAAARTPAIPGR